MVLGKSEKRIKMVKKEDPILREEALKNKLFKLRTAIKIPAPINQFNTKLESIEFDRIMNLFKKYSKETRLEKKERLSKENPKEGPKPLLLKSGLKHLVELISQKKVTFVVIAANVTPITTVIFLPTLCKKLNIPYAIVDSKEKLGSLVHLKRTCAVAIEKVRPEDQAELDEIIRISNAMFSEQYEKHMTTTGGNIHKVKKLE